MTRKHYAAVAALFKAEMERARIVLDDKPTDLFDRDTVVVIERLAHGFAQLAADDNPRFDFKRFYQAAGVF